jgi:hypothetical protein
MSGSARRLERRGHPVAGERLDAVEARYLSPAGHTLKARIDSDDDEAMLWLYGHLKECVRGEPIDTAEAFAWLDERALDSSASQTEPEGMTALEVVLNVHWLQHHGHLARDPYNGMLFYFSRPHPRQPGKHIGFGRGKLDATHTEERAFWKSAVEGQPDGTLLKVTPREGETFEDATVRGLEEWLARSPR